MIRTPNFSLWDAASEEPHRVALVTSEREFTFAELALECRSTLDELRDRAAAADGLEAWRDGPRLLLDLSPSPASLGALYAALELGLPFVPIHPRWSQSEREASAERFGCCLRSEEDGHWTEIDSCRGPSGGEPAASVHAPSSSLLAVLQTSGTSGTPRGVALSRRAFAASARASQLRLGWQDDDRWLLNLPLAHVGGLSVVTRCLLARRSVVLAEPGPFRPQPLIEWVSRSHTTLLSLVPTMLYRLVSEGIEAPSSVRALLIGGAAAPSSLLEEARSLGFPVLATYGMTESCSQVATQRLDRPGHGVGPPLEGVEIRCSQLPEAATEIELRGEVLLDGYWTPNGLASPLSDDGWFATGDLGYFGDGGVLHVVGRLGDRIITGGENVDPLEVEAVLEEHPGVGTACVFGVPHPEWGERVVCALERTTGESSAGVWAFARERLAAHQVPGAVVWCDSLPLNASFKLDRRACARDLGPKTKPWSDAEG